MVEWYEGNTPGTAYMVNEITGQDVTEHEFLFADWDHYLFKPVVPAGGAWLLTYDGTTYQSTDEGATWVKAYSFDKDETHRINSESVKEQASTVRNAVCGEEDVDGIMHETIEADFSNLTPSRFELHNKYWINSETGYVTRSISHTMMEGFDSIGTQNWVPAPGLTLPIPE